MAFKLSGTAGELGAHRIKLMNFLLCFGCLPEEFRVVVSDLDNWMANSSPPWSAYGDMMTCCLVALDKRPGVRPIGIGETLPRDVAKLVMRAAEDQLKIACGSLQLCASLEDGIEGTTHAVSKRRCERIVSVL